MELGRRRWLQLQDLLQAPILANFEGPHGHAGTGTHVYSGLCVFRCRCSFRGVSWGIAGFRFLVDKYFAFAYLFTNGAAGCDAAAVTAAVSSETSIVQRESESRLSLIICLPATISIPSEGGERSSLDIPSNPYTK